MKVYKSEYQGCYGGGMILVAANDAAEAFDLVANSDDYLYLFGSWSVELNKYLTKSSNMSPFTEIYGLTYKSETPAIIAENIYIE